MYTFILMISYTFLIYLCCLIYSGNCLFSVRKEDGRNKLLHLVKHTKIFERFSELLFLTQNEQFISFAWREQGTL